MLNMDEATDPTGGPSEAADHRAAIREKPLADLECRHGRLPEDRTSDCGCWLAGATPTLLDDLAAIRARAIADGRLPKETPCP